MMRWFGLRDNQWERIKDLLPRREGWTAVTAADNRLFVELEDQSECSRGKGGPFSPPPLLVFVQ
jgi:hypothetical protein